MFNIANVRIEKSVCFCLFCCLGKMWIDANPFYSKVLYSKNDVIIYKLGACFLRSYQDVKLFVNKFDH